MKTIDRQTFLEICSFMEAQVVGGLFRMIGTMNAGRNISLKYREGILLNAVTLTHIRFDDVDFKNVSAFDYSETDLETFIQVSSENLFDRMLEYTHIKLNEDGYKIEVDE